MYTTMINLTLFASSLPLQLKYNHRNVKLLNATRQPHIAPLHCKPLICVTITEHTVTLSIYH